MKNKLFTLIKKDLFLKFGSMFNSFTDKKTSTKEKLKSVIAPFIIIFYAYFINVSMIIPMVSKDITAGPTVLNSLIVASSLLCLILSITSTMSTFFLNDDVKILSKLPIKPKDIILSKIIDISLTNIIFFIVLFMPIAIYYGVKTGADVLYFISLILGIISVCLIIVSIVTLIVLLLMKYMTKIPNLKNLLQILYFVMFLVFFIGIQFIIPRNSNELDINTLNKVGGYSFFISKLFSSALGIKTFLNKYISLIILVLSSVVLPVLISNITEKHFISGLQQNSVSGHKHKKVEVNKIKRNSKTFALIKKEIADVLKTPVYFFNICISGIMLSIIFPLGFLFGAKNEGGMNFIQILSEIQTKLSAFVSENVFAAIFISILAGFVIAFFSSLSGDPATTSISREGERIRLLKTLPITSTEHVKSRILASIILKLISYSLIFLMAFILTFPHIYLPIFAMIGFSLSSFFTSNLGLLFDIKSPKLKWTNPQLAVKQNMNILKVMVTMIILGFITYKFLSFLIPILPDDIGVVSMTVLSIPILLVIIGYFLYIYNISIFEKNLIKYEN